MDVAVAQNSNRTVIRGGMVVAEQPRDTLAGGDSLLRDSVEREAVAAPKTGNILISETQAPTVLKAERKRYFTDSMSLSKVCWTATVLPGYGQIYNKEYWKLPILYGTLATSIALYVKETDRYKPMKAEYDATIKQDLRRTTELNELQEKMIHSNTRRQIYLGATVASYLYFIGDAAMNYSTNNESDVKRATTLATICPGAGQIYNKSYWKVPFVVGGFAAMIYVVDWNNRGYKRFKNAYNILKDYEANPDDYPNGSTDEFGGRYSASYMKSLRDSYRRNRDLSIIMMAGLYALQLIDAHVDAHFKDYDISDDLSMDIEPAIGYTYSPVKGGETATFGFNLALKF